MPSQEKQKGAELLGRTQVGVLVIADRGSVLQIVVAACLSLGFIVLHQSLWPYKLSADNVFKAAIEIQIFLTILVALVLKTDLRAEAVGGRPAARILSVDAFSSRRMAADAFSLCGIQQVLFHRKHGVCCERCSQTWKSTQS